MRRGQEAARRFHGKSERSSDFLCLPDLEDFLFCLRKKKGEKDFFEVAVQSYTIMGPRYPLASRFFFFFFVCTQSKSSGLQGNTKARSAAVHNKKLLAVGPEILHTERRKDTANRKLQSVNYHAITFSAPSMWSSAILPNQIWRSEAPTIKRSSPIFNERAFVSIHYATIR